MQKIGRYVISLHLKFDTLDSEIYVESGIGWKFLSLLSRSLGEQLRELELSGVICSIPVQMLAPIFFNLEKLSIYCDYDDDDDSYRKVATISMDLPQLCHNLRVLRIDNYALIFAPNPIKSFQNLEVLEFHSFGSYYPSDLFACFMKQNKHLKRLYVDNIINNDVGKTFIDLAVVGQNLKDLEELRIRTVVFENYEQGIRDFNQLHHLTTLVMTEYWDDLEQMNNVLDILKTLKQLKKLWIGYCFDDVPNQQSIVNIAIELKQLESFQIDFKCDLRTIIEVIRFGRSLQLFCVQLLRDRDMTSTFIKDLAKVRESVIDEGHQPLLIYFAHAKLNGELLKVFKDPGVERFLKWEYFHDVPYNPFEQ